MSAQVETVEDFAQFVLVRVRVAARLRVRVRLRAACSTTQAPLDIASRFGQAQASGMGRLEFEEFVLRHRPGSARALLVEGGPDREPHVQRRRPPLLTVVHLGLSGETHQLPRKVEARALDLVVTPIGGGKAGVLEARTLLLYQPHTYTTVCSGMHSPLAALTLGSVLLDLRNRRQPGLSRLPHAASERPLLFQ